MENWETGKQKTKLKITTAVKLTADLDGLRNGAEQASARDLK